ncbi:MAG: hypothetical protein ACK559_42425, partial [bacterium]
DQYNDEDEFYCGTNITLLANEYSDHDEDDQDPQYWGAVLSHDSSPSFSANNYGSEYEPVADDSDEYEANNYDSDDSKDLLPSTPPTDPPKPQLPLDFAPDTDAPPPADSP